MRLFVASHYNHLDNKSELDALNSIIADAGFEVFNFVTTYTAPFESNKLMMAQARKEISLSNALLVDVSEKSTGRMIETGIAYALGKKIVLIAKKGSFIKDTLRGIADLVVEYDNINDIKNSLSNFLLLIQNK